MKNSQARITLFADNSGFVRWRTNGIGRFIDVSPGLLFFLRTIDLDHIGSEMEERLSIGRDGILYYDPDMPDYSEGYNE